VAISHIYKDVCSLTQVKGLPSLIYHEPALEVRFVRGAEGTTSFLTTRVHVLVFKYIDFGIRARHCALGLVSPV